MADTTTRAARPARGGQDGAKGDTIMGLPAKTVLIVGAVVVVGGYLYIKSKTSQQGQGQGGGKGPQYRSPTGMSRQHLTIWVKDHHGHKHG